QAIGGFRLGYEGSQDWDMLLRFSEKTSRERIFHIPKILYHWRAIRGSAASGSDQKPYAYEAARRTVSEHLHRSNISAEVVEGFGPLNRIKFHLNHRPLVSLVIGTRDQFEAFKVLVEGILTQTSYENFEIIIVNNQSKGAEMLGYLEDLKQSAKARVIDYE